MRKRRGTTATGLQIRGILLMASSAAGWVYLGWRVYDTLPHGIALWFGIVLLLAEGMQTLQSTIFNISLFNPTRRIPPRITTYEWTVDVFITTYNEPVELLKRTIAASKNLEYEDGKCQIWVCDDGRREEVRELAEQWDVGYLTRPTNEHAKAGNLNNALRFTNGDLVVTLDADMVPKPDFLKKTAAFFTDTKVAFVQVPQSFFNQDIFQYNLFQTGNIPNEQDLFMRMIMTGRDRYNAAIYLGSNTVFRRTALEMVGGFATGTITEDLATGMLLQANGYRTIFLNEILAQGLATESFSDTLRQRIRWARGNIQVMIKWNPLTLPGLSFMQRMLYTSGIVHWYSGIWKLVFFISPLMYLIFGIPLLDVQLYKLLWFWLPAYVLSAISVRLITSNMRNLFWSHIYDTALAPTLAWAAVIETFTRKSLPFQVTPKGVTAGKTYFHKRLVAPHILLLLLSVFGIIHGIYLILNGIGREVQNAILINVMWAIYNYIGLAATIMLAFERPRMRNTERFARNFKIHIQIQDQNGFKKTIIGNTLDVSETGCRVLVHQVAALKEEVTATVYGRFIHDISGRIVYFDTHKDGFQAGIQFDTLSNKSYQKWINELYGNEVDDSAFKLRQGSSGFSLYLQYLKHFRFRYKPVLRSSPRIPVELECLFELLPSVKMSALDVTSSEYDTYKKSLYLRVGRQGQIRDIGLNGCQVWIPTARNCKVGDGIALALAGSGEIMAGRIVHVDRSRKKGLLIGVRWLEEETGKRLVKRVMVERQEGKQRESKGDTPQALSVNSPIQGNLTK